MTYRGVAHGKTTELEEALPYQDGQSVSIWIEPLAVVPPPGSVDAVLRAMAQPPHLTDEDVRELERSIEEGRLPASDGGIFDEAQG